MTGTAAAAQPTLDVDWCRQQFPALSRRIDGRPAVYLDGPAGSQVPTAVADAVTRYLLQTNANGGGVFATSRESDAVIDAARQAMANLLGSADPARSVFGPNMTTLTLSVARALARTWSPGDEVLVSRMEHDANYTPWVQAATDAGAHVNHIGVRREDATLDLESLDAALSDKTRLVAVGAASNAVGTLNPVQEIVRRAHAAGALVFVDAVHYAPHALMDVEAWGADLVACSAYKFFGPHVGILWGRRELLDELPVTKLRPPSNAAPHRWETGTQNHEGIAGTAAAVGYLADIGRHHEPAARAPRPALEAAFRIIRRHEMALADRLLDGLLAIPGVTVHGITDRARRAERVPTVAITHARHTPAEVAQSLAGRGIFVWSGNFYALPLTEALGLEPEGVVRIGLLHYNTPDEIDVLLEALSALG